MHRKLGSIGYLEKQSAQYDAALSGMVITCQEQIQEYITSMLYLLCHMLNQNI